jgi:hypothetical protein
MLEAEPTNPGAHAESAPAGQVVYRRILLVFSALAVVAIAGHLFVAFSAANEFTQAESIVAAHSRALAQQGTLYYRLENYPYTVCSYMPVFYLLQTALHKLGLPILPAGRLVSIAALLVILWLLWRTVELYSGDKYAAWTGLVLAGVTQLLLGWGTVAQVDMLASACSLASFYFYSRHRILGANTVLMAAACALAGLLTKQTALAAPASIFLLLAASRPAKALQFAAVVGGLGGAIVLGLNAWLDGRFLANTFFANMNPFAWEKLRQHLEFVAFALPTLLLVTALGARKAIRAGMGAPFVYLACALLVFLATCGKIGSDANYRVESVVALVLCSCLALHALDFFQLSFRQSRSWITLLLLPVGVYAVYNLRAATFALLERTGREREFAVQTAALQPRLAGNGRVLSTDINALFQARRSIEVEAFIYRLLVEAGRIDPAPLGNDLQAAAFSQILLYEDVNQPARSNPEIPRLTQAQLDIIRNRYRLTGHFPGPYLGGLYLYEPRGVQPPQPTTP